MMLVRHRQQAFAATALDTQSLHDGLDVFQQNLPVDDMSGNHDEFLPLPIVGRPLFGEERESEVVRLQSVYVCKTTDVCVRHDGRFHERNVHFRRLPPYQAATHLAARDGNVHEPLTLATDFYPPVSGCNNHVTGSSQPLTCDGYVFVNSEPVEDRIRAAAHTPEVPR